MILARYAAIAALAIIVAFVLTFFTGKAIIKISDSLAQKEKLSRVLAIKLDNIQQIKNSLGLLGDNDKKIQAAYLPADNILGFVNALESVAKQNSLKQNLRFGDFSPVATVNGISLVKTDYVIGLDGTITTLRAYLDQLEGLPFITQIGAVSLLASPPNGWNGDSNINIKASLYAQQPQ